MLLHSQVQYTVKEPSRSEAPGVPPLKMAGADHSEQDGQYKHRAHSHLSIKDT